MSEPFLDDRPLHNATKQEAADCLALIVELRNIRKLGGFGSIIITMKDGDCYKWETTSIRVTRGA